MVFLDSNLFIVERFFRRDALYPVTRRFIERLPDLDGAIPLMILLEICGAASFRLSARESEGWLRRFDTVYSVRVLNPFGAGDTPGRAWVASFADDISRYISRRMSFGDAILAREADRYGADALVTWNVKDFAGRTAVPVVSPEEYLARFV